MNTYGFRSVNIDIFNLKWRTNYDYPQQTRNDVVNFLKVHNLTLNILGYIPGVSVVSGCVRMGTGLLMCAVVLAVGKRDATEGVIVGHWYDECLLTGITQIGRGVLEAFVPFGWIANAFLDTVATVGNIGKDIDSSKEYLKQTASETALETEVTLPVRRKILDEIMLSVLQYCPHGPLVGKIAFASKGSSKMVTDILSQRKELVMKKLASLQSSPSGVRMYSWICRNLGVGSGFLCRDMIKKKQCVVLVDLSKKSDRFFQGILAVPNNGCDSSETGMTLMLVGKSVSLGECDAVSKEAFKELMNKAVETTVAKEVEITRVLCESFGRHDNNKTFRAFKAWQEEMQKHFNSSAETH